MRRAAGRQQLLGAGSTACTGRPAACAALQQPHHTVAAAPTARANRLARVSDCGQGRPAAERGCRLTRDSEQAAAAAAAAAVRQRTGQRPAPAACSPGRQAGSARTAAGAAAAGRARARSGGAERWRGRRAAPRPPPPAPAWLLQLALHAAWCAQGRGRQPASLGSCCAGASARTLDRARLWRASTLAATAPPTAAATLL